MASQIICMDAPESIRKRMALMGGELHVSQELKGNHEFLSHMGLLRRRGIVHYVFHEPEIFDKDYSKLVPGLSRPENEIQTLAKEILAKAYEQKASDIHIKDKGSHTIIRFRILGMLTDYDYVTAATGRQLIRTIYSSICQSADSAYSARERQEARIVDAVYLPEGVHSVRVHTEPTECKDAPDGVATCMFLRLLYDATEAKGSLEQRTTVLGFTEEQQATLRFLTRRTGLIIISGPTGHGKSTALKHVMESMAENNPEKSYLSVEDPPEYPLKGVDQVMVSNSKVSMGEYGKRAQMYTDAIAGAMRSDPDTLMIGEIRYPEAALAAINAAMTGHGVWATTHANNAFGIVTRLVSMLNSAGYHDSLEHLCDPNVLAGITYQRLIPVLCDHCKIPLAKATDIESDLQDRLFRVVNDSQNIFVRGAGCEVCQSRGIVSLRVAAEVVATDHEMLQLMRKNQLFEAQKYWIEEKKGLSYVRHAIELIESGVADPMLTEMRLGVPLDFDKSMEARS